MDRGTFLDKVLGCYAGSYDIMRFDDGAPLAAKAAFHEHGVGYMLTRKAEMWSADRHEYAWFYSVPHLTSALYDECYKQAYEEGIAMVDPGEDHMCTTISVVFICDSADADAVEKLKKTRCRKNYKFGLAGWSSVHTAAAELNTETVTSNGDGRPERNFLSSVLHPRKKKHIIRDAVKKLKDLI